MRGRVVLLGRAIGYSASPPMLNAAFRQAHLRVTYQIRDVDMADLASAVWALRNGSDIGANVTTPYKVAVLDLVDEIDPSAERAGAANVIERRGRRLIAHSTDLPAIADELRALAISSKRRAVVLGNGGAARAVRRALTDGGWPEPVTVTRDRWANIPRELSAADLLVNATPIGTNTTASPIPFASLRSSLGVLDLVYRPSPTQLVSDARRVGAPARAGAGTLLRQAALSFSIWTGQSAPLAVMRDALRAELGPEADV